MIKFIDIDSHKVIDGIPDNSSGRIFFDMYLDDKCVGQTIGRSNNLLVVNLFGQGQHYFKADVLKANLNSELSLSELLALGDNVG